MGSYLGSGSAVCRVRTDSARKPGSTPCRRQSARSSRPDAISSATEAVTSATTRTERSRSVRRSDPVRAPSRSPLVSDSRQARSAGTTPKPMPVSPVSSAANPSMRRSTPGTSAIGSAFGTRRAISGTTATASATPSAPPHAARIRLSVINWRTSRSRPAPIAVRTASSRRRESARARRRFARFVHAISRTPTAAPRRATSRSRLCGESSSRSRKTEMPISVFSFGYARSSCAAIRRISARARLDRDSPLQLSPPRRSRRWFDRWRRLRSVASASRSPRPGSETGNGGA